MGSNTKTLKKIRSAKAAKAGKVRKRAIRRDGTTQTAAALFGDAKPATSEAKQDA
jgi:hypothetical protein